jgi:hypothetical protein
MAEYQIAVTEEMIKSLNLAKDDEVLELICRDVKEDDGTLFRLLDHYCRDERGTVDDSTIEVEPEASVINPDCTGYLTISFMEFAHYGCRDMDVQDYHTAEVPFRIDITNRVIIFTVPDSLKPSHYHNND